MKKIWCFIIVLSALLICSSLVCYASEYDDYINNINNKYGLSLIKNDEVENNIDFDTFKNDIDKIVRAHIEYEKEMKILENRFDILEDFDEYGLLAPLSESYKTVTKRKHADNIFDIKATYDYCTETPYRVSNFRNISWHWQLQTLFESFTPNSGYPTLRYIDSHRSGYITYVGKYTNLSVTDSNYKFFASFSK